MSRKRKTITPFKSWEARNAEENGYARITGSLSRSYAACQISANAWRIYIDMRITAKGHHEVIYSRKIYNKYHNLSSATYTKCIRELRKWGFIEKIPRACFQASQYRFSEKWQEFQF